jgi:hypothetical protein
VGACLSICDGVEELTKTSACAPYVAQHSGSPPGKSESFLLFVENLVATDLIFKQVFTSTNKQSFVIIDVYSLQSQGVTSYG